MTGVWCAVWGHKFIGEVWDESSPWPFEPYKGYIPHYPAFKNYCTRCGAPKTAANPETTRFSSTVGMALDILRSFRDSVGPYKGSVRALVMAYVCSAAYYYVLMWSSSHVLGMVSLVATAIALTWAEVIP